MLVRFIAVAFIGLGMIELALSWLEDYAHRAPMRAVDFLLPAVLLVVGIAGLFKAGSLAEWLSNKLDE